MSEQPGYFDFSGTCCLYGCGGCFCPCIMTAMNVNKLREKSNSDALNHNPAFMGFCDLVLTSISSTIFSAFLRWDVQDSLADAFGKEKNGFIQDYCCHCFCPCIALAQQGLLADGIGGGSAESGEKHKLVTPKSLEMTAKE